ncbi:MAG TPA: hypothetical protein VMS11_04120 [Solirubrobacterales bacterium]|nr:hypothetical protein [Solirubrobacterales bacterium]
MLPLLLAGLFAGAILLVLVLAVLAAPDAADSSGRPRPDRAEAMDFARELRVRDRTRRGPEPAECRRGGKAA